MCALKQTRIHTVSRQIPLSTVCISESLPFTLHKQQRTKHISLTRCLASFGGALRAQHTNSNHVGDSGHPLLRLCGRPAAASHATA